MKPILLSLLLVVLVWTAGAIAEAQQVSATPPTASETDLEACRDKADNDADGHVDCDDQDCEVYALCVPEPAAVAVSPPAPATVPVQVSVVHETGRLCRDHVDNDGDGLVDCHEASCQGYHYCKKVMNERPLREDSPQGLIISLGLGAALPNYSFPSTATADTSFGNDIPFDPDFGGMADLKVGYVPLKWLGFGLTWKGAGTFASNEFEYFDNKDDNTSYRYEGDKEWRHMGAFVRLTYPFGRFVPYIDVSGGYTHIKYEWRVYSASTSWSDIDDWGDYEDDSRYDDDFVPRETERLTRRHFTLAVEPGFDYYVVPQTFALGLHAYLPVFASSNPSTDNIGAMLTFTVTPTWRGRPQLKAEYRK